MPHAETRAQLERSRRAITMEAIRRGNVLREVGRIAPMTLRRAKRRVERRAKL